MLKHNLLQIHLDQEDLKNQLYLEILCFQLFLFLLLAYKKLDYQIFYYYHLFH